MASVEIDGLDPDELEKILENVQIAMRGKVIGKGLRAAGKIVVKEYKSRITAPGYEGDKPGQRSLRDAIGYKGKRYSNGNWVGVVGARVKSPWRAHHAHLYEKGHRMIVSRGSRAGQQSLTRAFVPGKAALVPAYQTTRKRQVEAMEDNIRDEAMKASQ